MHPTRVALPTTQRDRVPWHAMQPTRSTCTTQRTRKPAAHDMADPQTCPNPNNSMPCTTTPVCWRLQATHPPILYRMAALQAASKYATLPPTVRMLVSGVPNAPSLNLPHRLPTHHHGHAGRSDVPLEWAGGYQLLSKGPINKSFTIGAPPVLSGPIYAKISVSIDQRKTF